MNTQATDRVGFSFFGALFRAVLISVFVLVLPTAASAAAVISAVGLLLNAQVAFNGEVATFTSNDSPAQPASTSRTTRWGFASNGVRSRASRTRRRRAARRRSAIIDAWLSRPTRNAAALVTPQTTSDALQAVSSQRPGKQK
jgi:hypothetical protein